MPRFSLQSPCFSRILGLPKPGLVEVEVMGALVGASANMEALRVPNTLWNFAVAIASK